MGAGGGSTQLAGNGGGTAEGGLPGAASMDAIVLKDGQNGGMGDLAGKAKIPRGRSAPPAKRPADEMSAGSRATQAKKN
jgi:hypothetical protein